MALQRHVDVQEAFTRATAYEYSWADGATSRSLQASGVPVEAGVSDGELDTLPGHPVERLSGQELRAQVQLLPTGFLGRGEAREDGACWGLVVGRDSEWSECGIQVRCMDAGCSIGAML
jgi:hypothetical protein